MLTLEAKERKSTGTKASAKLREGGEMPAVFYSGKEKTTSISIGEKDFEKVWKKAGESTVITLEGVGGSKEVLIHDVDIDPIDGTPRHVDFYVIEKGRKVTVDVPLEFTGVSSAVKEQNGTLIKVLHELEIEVMPKDLPHSISVDISPLDDFEKRILVKDIEVPPGVDVLTDPDEVVALVQPERVEEEIPAETPDLSQIEVEKKGKEEVAEAGAEGTPEKKE